MIYITKNLSAILYVNLKCCYSSFEELYRKGKILKIDKNKEGEVLISKINKQFVKIYIIVRCPYKRLKSFYNDKFIKNINNPKTQECQKNMYQYFDKDKLHSLQFSFSDFIDALKKGYNDPHIVVQSNIYKLRNRTQIIKMESPHFSDIIFNIIKSRLPHSNKTTYDRKIVISELNKKYIYDRYKIDFINFGYF